MDQIVDSFMVKVNNLLIILPPLVDNDTNGLGGLVVAAGQGVMNDKYAVVPNAQGVIDAMNGGDAAAQKADVQQVPDVREPN